MFWMLYIRNCCLFQGNKCLFVFFLEFHSFGSYISTFDPFWINFHRWCQVGIQHCSSTCEHSVVPQFVFWWGVAVVNYFLLFFFYSLLSVSDMNWENIIVPIWSKDFRSTLAILIFYQLCDILYPPNIMGSVNHPKSKFHLKLEAIATVGIIGVFQCLFFF